METKNQVPITGIQRNPIESSLLTEAGYSEATQTLEVQFKSKRPPGDVYQYANVPPEIYSDMLKADSIGSYFLRAIKPFPDKYPYLKIETEI